jgi:TolA-binding protein
MRPWIHIGAVIFCMTLAACGGGGDKAEEMLKTAEFEERQQNVAHAKQIYEEIIRLYPSRGQAEFARARLEKLNKAP